MLSEILAILHLRSPWQQLGLLAVVLTTAYAFWRGGPTERLGGAVMLAGWLATPFLLDLTPVGLDPYAILAIDLVMFGAIAAIALTSDRYWPMAVAAFFLLGAALHLAQLIDPQVALRERIAATHIFSYLTLVGLWAGMLLEAERDRAASRRNAAR